MDEILQREDALGIAALIRRGEVSPLEVLEAAIERAEKFNPKFAFMAQEHYTRARTAIARGLPKGPFTGVPFLLKDLNIYLKGEVTASGSRYFENMRAPATSQLAERYEKAGLVIFGKTTTPEMGKSPSTESKAVGNTRNPWNPDHSAGGSSGGAAVAVALDVIPAAHGSDGGGSIRIPASCCGVFGLKPSRGRIPILPSKNESTIGIAIHHALTRSVRDNAALLDATHGLEPGGRYTAPAIERPFLEEVSRNPGRLRIALQLELSSGIAADAECVEAAKAAAKLCEQLGHHVEEIKLPFDAEALSHASLIAFAAAVARDVEDQHKRIGVPPGPEVLETITLLTYEIGRKSSAVDLLRANNVFSDAALQMSNFMTNFEVILSPTLASLPAKIGVLNPSPTDMDAFSKAASLATGFTSLMNQTGQPSMSVPLAWSKSGLPIGILFSARYGDEATLFRLAGQLEQASPWKDKRPKLN